MLCFNGVFPLLMVFGSSERCLRRFLAESLSVIEMAAVGAKWTFAKIATSPKCCQLRTSRKLAGD